MCHQHACVCTLNSILIGANKSRDVSFREVLNRRKTLKHSRAGSRAASWTSGKRGEFLRKLGYIQQLSCSSFKWTLPTASEHHHPPFLRHTGNSSSHLGIHWLSPGRALSGPRFCLQNEPEELWKGSLPSDLINWEQQDAHAWPAIGSLKHCCFYTPPTTTTTEWA